MSLLVIDKLTLEKSKDLRKSRRPNFKMGVSPRVVDWLTPGISQGWRKLRSKFSKCVCRKNQKIQENREGKISNGCVAKSV
jgi:hypothetical protein